MDKLEVKAQFEVDDAGTITGIAWPAGSTDIVGDQIEPGSFNLPKALPIVLEHDQGKVVGVWESYAETDRGLEVKGRLFVEGVGPARNAHQLVRNGKVSGLSIGFRDGVFQARSGGGRKFSDLTITEISLCRRPVNPGARITSVKSMNKEDPMDLEDSTTEDDASAVELKALGDNFTKLTGTLEKMTGRLDKMEARLNRPAVTGAEADKQAAEVEKKAFATYLRRGSNGIADEERKALTVSNDPNGGYLAPAEMTGEFIRNLVQFSPIRSIASVRTTTAPSVKYPKRTGITNAQWEGETDESEESTVTFGQAEIVVRQVKTYVDISNQLMSDSADEVNTEVTLALSEDFGQKEGLAFVNGDGVIAPEGFMTNANVAFTANGGTTGLDPDALLTLMYALPAPYRNAGEWVMNGTTLGLIRQLKDDQGRYIWQPGLAAGQPETIFGCPVVEAIDMPDVAANAFPIAFGDFGTAYRIIDRLSLSILPDPYTQATKGITRIHATRRVGGGVLVPTAIRKLKYAAA